MNKQESVVLLYFRYAKFSLQFFRLWLTVFFSYTKKKKLSKNGIKYLVTYIIKWIYKLINYINYSNWIIGATVLKVVNNSNYKLILDKKRFTIFIQWTLKVTKQH